MKDFSRVSFSCVKTCKWTCLFVFVRVSVGGFFVCVGKCLYLVFDGVFIYVFNAVVVGMSVEYLLV